MAQSILLLLCVALAGGQKARVELSRPLLVTNASAIHSLEPSVPHPTAFCVGTDGRFSAVGSLKEVAARCTDSAGSAPEVLDAQGSVVLPGLIDSHSHLMDEGRRLSVADLSPAKDEQSAAAAARTFFEAHPPGPGKFLQGFGWDQNRWPSSAFPTKGSLDAVLPPDVPAYLDRIDGHAAWVNSAALRLGGVNRSTPDPKGGRIVRDASGEPTGVLVDAAKALVTRVIPAPTDAEHRSWLRKCLDECAALGLTGAHDMGQDPANLAIYQEMAEDRNLSLRINAYRFGRDEPGMGRAGKPTDPKLVEHEGLLNIRGVKFFMDGALGSYGAAMLQNYSDRRDLQGTLRMSPEEFRAAVTPWLQAGWQVATHAIGDRANRVVLDTYEALLREFNLTSSDHRLRVEHAQILSPEDIPRFSKLGVLPSMQPDHAMFDMAWAPVRIGTKRLSGAYAWQKLLGTGIRALPFGSDFPTAGVVNPWWGIHAAVTRQDLENKPDGGWLPEERVTVEQALQGYTLDAAFAARTESVQGSITVGKHGDFVLIDRDILAVKPSQIWQTKVLGTYLGGRRVGGSAPVANAAAVDVEEADPRPIFML